MLEIEFRAMGSTVQILLESADTGAQAALRKAPRWFAEWENRLSRFIPDSELNCLNRNGGGYASEDLWAALQAALYAARYSNGLVTPTVLPALLHAGYDISFEKIAARYNCPDAVFTWPQSRPCSDWQNIECCSDTRSIRLHGAKIDLGGTAKGWSAQQAANRLAGYGAVLVNAGGDIAISGTPETQPGWPIAIIDAINQEKTAASFYLQQGCVATSGRDYRRWQRQGQIQHHIINPANGLPAQSDIACATVTAPNIIEAETAAKTLVILGSIDAQHWLADKNNLSACWYSETQGWQTSGNFDWLHTPHTALPDRHLETTL
ncbi:FAD:protein FMN transferase [Neisseria sp. S1]|uniref:FAD:protein FMN transferase n=1 Tax=Neisseria sp. S1 TaxID=3318354 RepID=UPI003A836E4D